MIDTIVLHIHNLNSYKFLYEQVFQPTSKKDTVTELYVEKETGEVTERAYVRNLFYSQSSKFLPVTHRGNISVPSWDYNVRYRTLISEVSGGKMEIEFSIPKYIYGTNLFQFLGTPPGDRDWET